MKKSEILKIQIILTIFLLLLVYIFFNIVGYLMEITENVNPVIVIIIFCSVIYKILKMENEWRY